MKRRRPYRLGKRAAARDETRRRILQAAMELHEETGPGATTISAIAERAGVQRLTVYRHFADDAAIFRACTAHWLELNPPPDPAVWHRTTEPWERVRVALSAFYDYYRATERMWSASHRDVVKVPALRAPMADFAASLNRIADDLASAVGAATASAKDIRVTLEHALGYPAWADLESRGLTNPQKVELAAAWLRGVAHADSARDSGADLP